MHQLGREMHMIENKQVKSSAYSDSRRARPKGNPTKRKNIDWTNGKMTNSMTLCRS
jgi:hypothetical protein